VPFADLDTALSGSPRPPIAATAPSARPKAIQDNDPAAPPT